MYGEHATSGVKGISYEDYLNLSFESLRGTTPFNEFSMEKLDKLAERLFNTQPTEINNFPLRYYSFVGNLEKVQELLDRGADPEAAQDEAIIFAAAGGHIQVMELLESTGRTNAFVREGLTLIMAARHGHLNVVKYLIEELNMDPNIRLNDPIIQAVKHGHVDIVKYLIQDVGMDPSIRDDEVLIEAARSGNIDIVRLLLEDDRIERYGSDYELAIYVSQRRGHKDVTDLLEENFED